MFDIKPISKEAIPRALEKAERYRLLNHPWEAESLCRDVLEADTGNQHALVILVLALTDQFGRKSVGVNQAREALAGLRGEYEITYYHGVICERWAKVQLRENLPSSVAFDWLHEAMTWYEKASELSSPGNEDAILRWNSCARVIRKHNLQPRDEEGSLRSDSDHDVPLR